jgi:hypothetical protein
MREDSPSREIGPSVDWNLGRKIEKGRVMVMNGRKVSQRRLSLQFYLLAFLPSNNLPSIGNGKVKE